MESLSNNQINIEDAITNHGNTTMEPKELDLISQLERNPNESTGTNCQVDCTLKLGLAYDQRETVPKSNQNPEPAVMPSLNMIYYPSQVTHNYGLVNGIGDAYSTRFAWIPRPMMIFNNTGGFGLYGSSSMAVPILGSSNNVGTRQVLQMSAKSNPLCAPVRKCFICQTTTTPLWRKGPSGAKSLCNACGLQYRKECRIMVRKVTEDLDNSANVSNPHKKKKV